VVVQLCKLRPRRPMMRAVQQHLVQVREVTEVHGRRLGRGVLSPMVYTTV
jgi:hypothetical protein